MNTPYYYGEPLRLGTGPQLLIDDALVEDRWRLTRRIHPPQRHPRNPVVVIDQPWEGDYFNVPVVLWDQAYGKFRMWYGSLLNSDYRHHDLQRKYVLYAESSDGINWEKPLFDLHPYGEHRRTNIVYTGSFPGDPARYGAVCDQVFIDAADPDPARRYKMLTYEARPDSGVDAGRTAFRFADKDLDKSPYTRGVNLAVSPDGIRWKLASDRHILDYNSDTSNNCTYDPQQQRWLLYVRPKAMHASGLSPHQPTPGFHPAGRHHSRRVSVMTSKDFVQWSYPRTCLYPDERDAPDYDATSVFRCGSHFIMLYTAMDDDQDGTKDVRLASSVDGFHWTRFHSRAPFIPRGRPGDFDAGQIARISSAPPVRVGNKLYIYYQGAEQGQHLWQGTTAYGVVTTQADRFVMQWAGDEPAWLITREFILEGNRLRLNLWYPKSKDVEHSLKVAIVRHPPLGGHKGFKTACEGFSLADCDVVKENGVEALVTWRGQADLSALRGQPVYLRFELRNMGLFGFRTPVE
ncbi:MAG: hypothetical protein JNG83_15250 [Opitutaceae bacterium]|nr:hypothetical protein [Opitutaceae bacterium]